MTDFFERLGQPRRFSIDAAALEREYLASSRAVHPDFHSTGSASDLTASLEASATLNEAYNTLRQPFARAEYLLSLLGGPTAAEHKAMPAAFLAEMLEAREAVEVALASASKESETTRLDREFRTQQDQLLHDAAQRFAKIEAMPTAEAGRTKLLTEIRGLLNAIRFVQGLLRDLHAD